jgi:transcriptional accessory protein Tex/SPT6
MLCTPGLGMYQHDVSERALTDKLAAVVQDCVAEVGVELNTASEHLLRHVSGYVALTDWNTKVTHYASRLAPITAPPRHDLYCIVICGCAIALQYLWSSQLHPW